MALVGVGDLELPSDFPQAAIKEGIYWWRHLTFVVVYQIGTVLSTLSEIIHETIAWVKINK